MVLTNATSILTKRGNWTQREDHEKTQREKTDIYKPRRESRNRLSLKPSEGTNPAGLLRFGFLTSRTGR